MGSPKGDPGMGHGKRHPMHQAGGGKTEGNFGGVKNSTLH